MTGSRTCPRGVCSIALIMVLGCVLVVGPAVLSASSQPPPAQDEFVPLEQAPPGDQLPAAPLLVAAYAVIWIAVFVYLWSIWRRMTTVERELAVLSKRTGTRDETDDE